MKRKLRRGSNAIEFALTAPILFMAMFGLFECGWFFCNNIIANEMTIDLSRSLAMHGIDKVDSAFPDEAQASAETWKSMGMPGEPYFQYEIDGDRIIVNSFVEYSKITPMGIFSDEITLTASSFIITESI